MKAGKLVSTRTLTVEPETPSDASIFASFGFMSKCSTSGFGVHGVAVVAGWGDRAAMLGDVAGEQLERISATAAARPQARRQWRHDIGNAMAGRQAVSLDRLLRISGELCWSPTAGTNQGRNVD